MRILQKFSFVVMSLLGFVLAVGSSVELLSVFAPTPASADDRAAHHHSLMIFAPDMLSKTLAKQLSAFTGKEEDLEFREISLVYVVGRTASAQLGSNIAAPAVKLRARYKVPLDEFRTVLADGNGEIELISDAPITTDQLFETTDAVPVTHEANR